MIKPLAKTGTGHTEPARSKCESRRLAISLMHVKNEPIDRMGWPPHSKAQPASPGRNTSTGICEYASTFCVTLPASAGC
jgi:hypothetical protein